MAHLGIFDGMVAIRRSRICEGIVTTFSFIALYCEPTNPTQMSAVAEIDIIPVGTKHRARQLLQQRFVSMAVSPL